MAPTGHVLFVREDDNRDAAHLVTLQDPEQLLARFLHARAVRAVNHEDQACRNNQAYKTS